MERQIPNLCGNAESSVTVLLTPSGECLPLRFHHAMGGDQFVLEVDLRDALDPLLQLFHLDHALALHVSQELGELPVRGLLHVERPIGLGYHVDSEEVAAQHGQLHFLCRRFPRLRQDSDLITLRTVNKSSLFWKYDETNCKQV